MVADDLATQGARTSAAMVLTHFSGYIPVSAPKMVNFVYTQAQLTTPHRIDVICALILRCMCVDITLCQPGRRSDGLAQTGLKLENYYFFTFTFSRPEVRKLLLFYVFTFSRPEVRKLLLFYVFTFSRPEVRKLFRIYVFTFSRPEVRKLFRIYVFTFSRPARPQ